jgi:methylenetetrahydrofolate reductase (NADPH)
MESLMALHVDADPLSKIPASAAPSSKIEPGKLKRAMAELMTTASLEMGAHRPGDAKAIASLLPRGTCVFVNHLPRHTINEALGGLIAVRDAGLEPVPHLAARLIGSRQEARVFLERAVRQGGVKKLLLIGGDTPDQAGPYPDATSLLRDSMIRDAGIREVAFAAYPEGHAHIPNLVLAASLDEKLALASSQGLGTSVLTQFCFAPHRITELAVELQRRAPKTPVYVGLAGPTDPRTLLKYAQVCGVSASLRALTAQGFGAIRLITHTDPGEQLTSIAHHNLSRAGSNIVGVHVYSFGGATNVATWMNQIIRGG